MKLNFAGVLVRTIIALGVFDRAIGAPAQPVFAPTAAVSNPIKSLSPAEGYYSDRRDTIILRIVEDRFFAELPDASTELTLKNGVLGAATALPIIGAIEIDPQGRFVRYRGHRFDRGDWKEPPLPTPDIAELLGDYVNGNRHILIFERNGSAYASLTPDTYTILFATGAGRWAVGVQKRGRQRKVLMTAIKRGLRTVTLDNLVFTRRGVEEDRPTPVSTEALAQFRAAALQASPPTESGKRPADLVSLTQIDPTIQRDIRYATSNNFVGLPVYRRPVAMMQRPAAEALARVNEVLRRDGYGLVVFDAYRPWYVTKIFWDAASSKTRAFLADPAEGSRHNRGCAVDLSLYKIATGQEVEMPGAYDETSPRSYPTYIGGTTHQRWLREKLRTAMAAGDFGVDGTEWWHFNYADWAAYPIGNMELTD